MGNLFLSFLKLGLIVFDGQAMVAYIKEMSVQCPHLERPHYFITFGHQINSGINKKMNI
ncbi:MAG TPA: hypothetical protein VJW95_02090 [Dissulfurispiraceae bacterium]|nr:hypothetical protein [Dissulfurispiraceae bacterium]